MSTEDYKPVVSGSLKLKGVQDSGIKKKKKRPKPPLQSTSNQDFARELSAHKIESDAGSQSVNEEKEKDAEDAGEEEAPLHGRAKTEAEIRHEERRRKRVWIHCSKLAF